MNCPNCGAWSKVLDTRTSEDGYTVWRRHRCANDCKPFKSVQVLQAAYSTKRGHHEKAIAAARNRAARKKRNAAILRDLKMMYGKDVARKYGLSNSAVSLIKLASAGCPE